MFAMKILLIVMALAIIISIIHRCLAPSFAEQKCQNVLAERFAIESGGGWKNFEKSFKTLSVKKIEDLYKEVRGESDEEATERLLKLLLVTDYYLTLFKIIDVKKINFTNTQIASQWCIKQANTMISNLPDFAINDIGTDVKKLEKKCKNYINLYIERISYEVREDDVFKSIYENGTQDLIQYVKLMGAEAKRNNAITLKYNTFFINKFTIPFYNQYTKLLKDLETKGLTFISVYDYCEDQGQRIVIEYYALDFLT